MIDKTLRNIGRVAVLIAILFCGFEATAKTDPSSLYDLSIEENLSHPKVGKQANSVSDFQNRQAKAIKEAGYITEMMRRREVIIVTIPAANLFEPNDTVLSSQGESQLKRFTQMLKLPDFYRMVLVMHSDNTGSKEYTYDITRARVESVMSFFETNAKSTDFVIPYAVGDERPIKDNTTIANRAYNRRLEIFLVPGEVMIDAAKDGSLANRKIFDMK